jgi:hypothetical protein
MIDFAVFRPEFAQNQRVPIEWTQPRHGPASFDF